MWSAATQLKGSIWTMLAVGLIASLPGAVVAQSQPTGDKLDEIERQVKALQKLVEEVRSPTLTPTAPASGRPDASADAASRSGSRGRDRETVDPIVAKIRDEGLNHSQVMATLDYLTNVIGQRLTGSPNARRANEWTRGKLEGWGLTSARLESWGPFGRGWVLKRFSIQVIQPQTIPLIACPKAWTPGFDRPLEAAVVWLDAKTDADLKKYEGKLKGAIVLADPLRPLNPHFEAPGVRMTDADLLTYANSTGRRIRPAAPPPKGTPSTEFSLAAIAAANAAAAKSTTTAGADQGSTRRASSDNAPAATNDGAARGAGDSAVPTSDDPSQRRRLGNPFSGKALAFCAKEGAALVLTSSPMGDGGTVFVASASVPGSDARFRGGPKPWSEDAPAMPPQVCVAVEDYNRLVRMIQQGEELKMAVDLEVQFTPAEMANNTVAEIAGSDLKDEIVMVGGHLDSWHAGTGATDNGAGVAVAMEAMRILKAAGVKPRRTIRIGLWTGEEQGLLGSRAYVTQHFGTPARGFDMRPTDGKADTAAAESKGSDTNPADSKSGDAKAADPKPAEAKPTDAKTADAKPADAKPVRLPEHDKLSVYFNLDNGTGRIRGIFTQGNEAAVPLFRKWLIPFHDLGADTVSLANTGSTDHISFEAVTLPGFEFMQDPIEYMSRSHHSNEDVFDRVPEDDLKQAAVIMAAFAYNAAMMDQRFPRKATE
jgi:carboxypeptidase Q